MRDKNLHFCSSESAAEQSEMEVVLWCKNDVCVGAFSVNFTMLYLRWFVSHFTVGVMRLLLSSRVSVLVINEIITTAWHNSEMRDKPHKTRRYESVHFGRRGCGINYECGGIVRNYIFRISFHKNTLAFLLLCNRRLNFFTESLLGAWPRGCNLIRL